MSDSEILLEDFVRPTQYADRYCQARLLIVLLGTRRVSAGPRIGAHGGSEITVDVTHARKLLDARLAEIGHSSDVLTTDGHELGSGDLSHIHQHPGDQGSDLSDNEREVAILDAGAADRVLIEEAIARIDAGTYGTCIVCGKAIPDERLEARPEVARCVEDQQKYEASRA
jgi:DnaK suppressor protein